VKTLLVGSVVAGIFAGVLFSFAAFEAAGPGHPSPGPAVPCRETHSHGCMRAPVITTLCDLKPYLNPDEIAELERLLRVGEIDAQIDAVEERLK